jgi:hypothetical protein
MKSFFHFALILPGFLALAGSSLSQGIDWGDALDPPFPTLAVNNGAGHQIVPGFFLGFGVDPEFDGQPSGNASGDDNTGMDDADGIIFNSWLIPGQQATLLVIASAPGMLDAWIDFSANMSWGDPGEQIFTSAGIPAGYTVLTYNVPQTAAPGFMAFARFRFSTAGGLPFTGLAADGEVEDYMVVIGPPPTGQIFIDPDPARTQIQNEISLALVPGTLFGPPSLLVAAYNDEPFVGGPGIGISYSTDGGSTWGNTQLQYPVNPFLPAGSMQHMFDPSITVDGSGNVFASYVATDGATGGASGLFVSKSIDGGITWSVPDTVAVDRAAIGTGNPPDTAYRFNDRDQINADRYPESPYYNRIYVTWIKDRGFYQPFQPWSDIYFSYSSDGGSSFSSAHRINAWSNSMGNMPVVDVAKDGKVYVAWMHYNVQTGGQGIIFLDHSTDGGLTWSADVPVDTVNLPPLNLSPDGVLAKGAAVMRVQPADPNELYVVYAADPDAAGPDEADIFFIKSTDGGTNWSTAIRINDDATNTDQVLPWMTVKPNGIIEIAWYDRRNDPNDQFWDVFYSFSFDRGSTFSTNTRLNMLQFFSPATGKFGTWYGEYLALASDYQKSFVVHTSANFGPLGDVELSAAPVYANWKDYGDAPDPMYQTKYYNLGASHVLDGVTYLGTWADAEPDGIPDPAAMGDDNYQLADEDGIVFPATIYAGLTDTIAVSASVGAYFSGWIDFNNDGDWADGSEQVYTDLPLSPGNNKLLLSVPFNAVADTTFARFRISSVNGLSYTGEAPDGEVEDYLIVIQAQTGMTESKPPVNDIKIYPNPASVQLTVVYNIPDEGSVFIKIYDLYGRLVSRSPAQHGSKGMNRQTFKLATSAGAHLDPGIYLAEVVMNDQPVSRQKLLILEK